MLFEGLGKVVGVCLEYSGEVWEICLEGFFTLFLNGFWKVLGKVFGG